MANNCEVPSCCGCCSVRTGVVIIATLQIVLSMMMVILTYTVEIRWEEVMPSVDPNTAKIISTITLCIGIFIAVLLLVGVSQKNTSMMLPWLVVEVIGTVSVVINIVSIVVVCFVNHFETLGVSFLIAGLIALVIHTFLWLVVYSYFQQLKRDEKNSRIGRRDRPPNYQQA